MALTYAQAVRWYYSFASFDPHAARVPDELKLARLRQILARLGDPHLRFPSILIAGTKGKGSTGALLESILRAAGFRTGLYTSPHLHNFGERIRVAGELIRASQVIGGTARLQRLALEFPNATFFEWVTALAFDHFARQEIEIAVLEVGLGGRLDCTNVVTPRVSIITPISYDHMQILGHTLAEIAREKAGIIKPRVPVVVAPQPREALPPIRAQTAAQHAPVHWVAREWRWRLLHTNLERQIVHLRSTSRLRGQIYHLPLLGPHQRVNLATALTACAVLREQGWRIPDAAMRRGVAQVQWPARFEILRPSPSSGTGKVLVADGAHNRASAHEFVRTLDEVLSARTFHLVFGASSDKDVLGMLEELLPRAASVIFTQAQHLRALSPDALLAIVQAHPQMARSIHAHVAPNVAAALELAYNLARPGDVIGVTGSLFIAAEAREVALKPRYVKRIQHRIKS